MYCIRAAQCPSLYIKFSQFPFTPLFLWWDGKHKESLRPGSKNKIGKSLKISATKSCVGDIKKIKEKIRTEIYPKIIGDEYILVEAREVPTSGRVSNIVNCMQQHPYYLAMGCTDQDTSDEISIKPNSSSAQIIDIYKLIQ